MARARLRGPVRARYGAAIDASSSTGALGLGLGEELDRLRKFLDAWVETCDPEVRELVRYQLSSPAKQFRPLTVFACHRALPGTSEPDDLLAVAAAVELFHNYAIVLNDIIDRQRVRRGKLALHCRHGRLPALMLSAYLAFGAGELIAEDQYVTVAFTELGQRIAAAECRQWQLRDSPFGTERWHDIAEANSGAVFETCARVATRGETLVAFGRLLGTLYHGCEDVADLRATLALGVPAKRELVRRVLTLPAAVATDDPTVASLYSDDRLDEGHDQLAGHLLAALPGAEEVLDDLARRAENEARRTVPAADVLIKLVRTARALSMPSTT